MELANIKKDYRSTVWGTVNRTLLIKILNINLKDGSIINEKIF